MSAGVMVTLIICLTIIILFGTIVIAGVVLSRKKDKPTDNSTGPHLSFTAQDFKDRERAEQMAIEIAQRKKRNDALKGDNK